MKLSKLLITLAVILPILGFAQTDAPQQNLIKKSGALCANQSAVKNILEHITKTETPRNNPDSDDVYITVTLPSGSKERYKATSIYRAEGLTMLLKDINQLQIVKTTAISCTLFVPKPGIPLLVSLTKTK